LIKREALLGKVRDPGGSPHKLLSMGNLTTTILPTAALNHSNYYHASVGNNANYGFNDDDFFYTTNNSRLDINATTQFSWCGSGLQYSYASGLGALLVFCVGDLKLGFSSWKTCKEYSANSSKNSSELCCSRSGPC